MIEVEIKFPLTGDNEKRAIEGAKFVGAKLIRDVYWDRMNYELIFRDWWLRERNGIFELKKAYTAPTPGRDHFVRRYFELTKPEDIMTTLGLPGTSLSEALSQNGFRPFITIETNRSSYQMGRFRIDLDRTDTNYHLGEVELLIEDNEDTEAAKNKIKDWLAERGIVNEMVQVGKVAHYIRRHKPDLFARLVKANVIGDEKADLPKS